MTEPIFNRWFMTKDEPVPDDPDAWIVIARPVEDQRVSCSDVVIIKGAPGMTDPRSYWLRIPPPPWLEGK